MKWPPLRSPDYDRDLSWLVTLALHPGAKDYAWGQAKLLENDPTRMWAGICEELIAAVRAARTHENQATENNHGGTRPAER